MTDEAALHGCTIEDPGKPTLSPLGLLAGLGANLRSLPDLVGAYLGAGRLDPALREGVMVAVSRMNRCRHCTAIHGAWAELVGLSEDELARLDEGDPQQLDRAEWLAIQYARCLLAGDDPAPLEAELGRHLPPAAVRGVAAVARLIDLANRTGNTWDAFEARLRGRPAGPGSRLADELVVLAAVAPVGAPGLLASKLVRTFRSEPRL